MSQDVTDVIIVGAGPTGLFLALLLARLGVGVRIVDETEGPGTTSRALAVQARTLEIYRQVGLAAAVVKRGLVLDGVNLWDQGERAAHINLKRLGAGKSPYPFGVIFPQDEHEKLLVERLEAAGVRVERRTKATALEQRPAGVRVELRGPDGGTRPCDAAYVAGCDGARSMVRQAIGAAFPGGTYEHQFYVADVTARGEPMNKELHVFLDDAGFLGLFPLAGDGRARLVGTIRDEALQPARALEWSDVDRAPIARAGIEVVKVNWFSTYRVHHRVADRFRSGRAFLLGDAAHIHSPVGGQGMNTGLGDAMNLAWKLAAVLARRGNEDLLDTFEPERIAFARRLVATTDRAFVAASSTGKVAQVLRTRVVPRLVSRIARTSIGQGLLFGAVSQIGIEYRRSAWSLGQVGPLHGGDRLPWIGAGQSEGPDNFTPLASLEWQLHAFGEPAGPVRAACEERAIPVHVMPCDDRAKAAGFREGASYLVRPDGYVAAALAAEEAAVELPRYLAGHGIQGARPPGAQAS